MELLFLVVAMLASGRSEPRASAQSGAALIAAQRTKFIPKQATRRPSAPATPPAPPVVPNAQGSNIRNVDGNGNAELGDALADCAKGAVAGATIGSAIAPGAGTAFGAGVGCLVLNIPRIVTLASNASRPQV